MLSRCCRKLYRYTNDPWVLRSALIHCYGRDIIDLKPDGYNIYQYHQILMFKAWNFVPVVICVHKYSREFHLTDIITFEGDDVQSIWSRLKNMLETDDIKGHIGDMNLLDEEYTLTFRKVSAYLRIPKVSLLAGITENAWFNEHWFFSPGLRICIFPT